MSARRTPAQWFCLLGGGLLLARGLVGFALLDSSFDLPGEGWHHLVHLVSGAVLLAAGREPAGARFLAIAFGAFYTAVALAGIVDGSDVAGVIAADTADKTFHTVLGLSALGAGLASGGRARTQPASH
ncbi:MAG TPA: DUF4383 domain-containing protein [Thermoleophilaceae bacterium]|nr:DUF4383 domain-containing protein [Thermoleophilaceae bacterium]